MAWILLEENRATNVWQTRWDIVWLAKNSPVSSAVLEWNERERLAILSVLV